MNAAPVPAPQSGTSVGNSVSGVTVAPGSTLNLSIGNSENSGTTFGHDGKASAPGTGDKPDQGPDLSTKSLDSGSGGNGTNTTNGNFVDGIQAGNGTNLTNNIGNSQTPDLQSAAGSLVSNHTSIDQSKKAELGDTSTGDNSTVTNNVGSTITNNANDIKHEDTYYQNYTTIVEHPPTSSHPSQGGKATFERIDKDTSMSGYGESGDQGVVSEFLKALTDVSGKIASITVNFVKPAETSKNNGDNIKAQSTDEDTTGSGHGEKVKATSSDAAMLLTDAVVLPVSSLLLITLLL